MFQFVRAVLASLAVLLVLPVSISPARAATAPFVESVVLVGFKPGTPASARAEARTVGGAIATARVTPLDEGLERLTLAPGRSVQSAIEALLRNPNVRYAEPDYILTKATANDSYFTGGSLWGMYGAGTSPANPFGSNAAAAWARGYTGSRNVYVGVIDEGIQITHPDLAANIWSNPVDGCGASVDGLDNDGNGRADDCNGWDFFSNDRTVYDGTGDDHGTHVAGTIGGVGGNNAGVVGVNWAVTLISAKFLGPSGGYTSGAIAAVDYLTDLKTRHGLNIVATSNSWGGGGYNQSLRDAIRRGGDANILFIAAAGNSSSNNDAVVNYPSNYDCSFTLAGQARGWDCVIAVASITSAGALSSFSNYGATTVDIGAPGSSINSTLPSNTYGSYSGTSMATPHVSGAAALCASINPAFTARQIRQAIIDSTAPTASLAGKTVTGGRLDVGAMSVLCEPAVVSPVSGTPGNLQASPVSTTSIGLNWSDAVSDESSFVIQRSTTGCSGTFTEGGTAQAGSTSTLVTNLQPGTAYCFRVAGKNSLGTGAWSNTAEATTLPAPVAPSNLAATAASASEVNLTWTDNGFDQGYEVGRATSASGPFTVVTPNPVADATSYSVTGLVASTTYHFRVRAAGSGTWSGYSNTASATTLAGPPSAPSNVTTPLSRDKRTVTITWRDNSTNETGFEVRRLQRNANGTWPTPDFTNFTNLALVRTTGANATTSASTTDTPGPGTYRYYVRALNGSLASGWANSATNGVSVR